MCRNLLVSIPLMNRYSVPGRTLDCEVTHVTPLGELSPQVACASVSTNNTCGDSTQKSVAGVRTRVGFIGSPCGGSVSTAASSVGNARKLYLKRVNWAWTSGSQPSFCFNPAGWDFHSVHKAANWVSKRKAHGSCYSAAPHGRVRGWLQSVGVGVPRTLLPASQETACTRRPHPQFEKRLHRVNKSRDQDLQPRSHDPARRDGGSKSRPGAV